MSHYAENTGRHCMAVLILAALSRRLRTANIPTEAEAKRNKQGFMLLGTRCNVVAKDGAILIEGRSIADWAKSGIAEAQAKEVMLARGTGVLKKCSWAELWRAYKNN